MKKTLKRLLSLFLSAVLFTGTVPAQAFSALETDVYLPEVLLDESILQSDVFYLASTSAQIEESGHNVYLLRVGRGGDALSASTALIKIADVTAKYGEDYIVRVRGEAVPVDDPDDNLSVLEMMQDSEYVQSDMTDTAEWSETLEKEPEAQEAYKEGLETALDFLETASGLDEKYDGEDPYASASKDLLAEPDGDASAAVPESEASTDLPDSGAESAAPADSEEEPIRMDERVRPADGSERLTIGDSGESGLDPVQQAANLFAGTDAASQRLTTEGDLFQDLQAVANVLTDVVVGASVELSFAPGEKEKYLELVPLNNRRGDGDRMFYLVLGTPKGSSTNSAASTCAVTILDDEEQEPSVLSFSEETYTHTPGDAAVTVTIERTGALNSVVSATVRTTGEGSARMGRDYSQVDREIFFPFGISTVSVDVPVRTEYLSGDGTFVLELLPGTGCSVELGSATVFLSGSYSARTLSSAGLGAASSGSEAEPEDERAHLMATTTDRNNLATVRTLDELDLSKPYQHGNENNYFGGHNSYDSDKARWQMDWTDSTIFRDRSGLVGVVYELCDSASYWISGAQVTWDRSNHHAVMSVAFDGAETLSPWYTQWGKRWGDNSSRFCYRSSTGFNMETKNFYPSEYSMKEDNGKAPHYIGFYNEGRCDDCNWLWLYHIKPILRPFQINLKPARPLSFLQADGSMSDDGGIATKSTIVEAGTQLVAFVDDKFTVAAAEDANINKYAALDGVEWVTEDGRSLFSLSYGENSYDSPQTVTLDKELIGEMATWYPREFEGMLKNNPYVSDAVGYANYAQVFVQPYFSYIDATVTLRNPYDFGVQFYLSGTNYYISPHSEYPITYTYHKGDTLALSSIRLDSDAANQNYSVVGANIAYKFQSTDADYKESNPEFRNGAPIYISGSNDNRLNYKEVIVEPRLQEKNNEIRVRVRTSDLSRFVTSGDDAGLLGQTGTVEGDYTYFTYARPEQTVNGKLYAITATPAGSDTVCCWYDPVTSRSYTGNTLYFTAGSSPSRNTLTLSPERAGGQVTLTGTLRYTNYDLRTLNAGGASNVPALGAVLTVGSAGGAADANGYVTAGPIPITNSGDRYLRYMISVNGNAIIRETLLPADGGTIDISANFPDGVSPVSSNIFRDIQVTGVMGDPAYQVIDGRFIPVLYNGTTATITVKVKPSSYVVSLTGKDGLIEQTLTEAPKSVQLIVYDSNDVYRGAYDLVDTSKRENGYQVFTSTIDFQTADTEPGDEEEFVPGFVVEPGDRLYLRLVTDRLAGAESLSSDVQDAISLIPDPDPEEAGTVVEDYQYSDIYTGLSFYSPVSTELPPKQGIDSPILIDFPELPLIGSTGMNFAFPFLTVGVMRIEQGYRMYFGVSVVQIIDAIRSSHIATFSADDGEYWKDLFSIKHPFNTFKEGFNTVASQIDGIRKNAKNAPDGPMSRASLGSPQWTFDVSIGAYFDFYYYSVYNGDVEETGYKFGGAGLYLNVSVGFKTAWYIVLPVVFLPAYLGIEVQATVMGFLGAKVDYDKEITFDQAQHSSVDFTNATTGFNGAVRAVGFVQICLGVGLCGTLGVRAAGRVNMIANYEPVDNPAIGDFGFYVGLSAGIIIDLFLFSVPLMYEFAGWPFGSFEYYANSPGENLNAAGASVRSPSLMDDSSDPFRLRAGSGEESEWRGNSQPGINYGFTPTSSKTLVQDAYERPDAQLLTLTDGTVVLAFLDADSTKNVYQRTTLKLAAFHEGQWSEAVAVSLDNTADFQPSIAETKDGGVLVAWVSTGSDNIDESTSTVDYLNSMEVYAAFVALDHGEIRTTTRNGTVVADTTVTCLTRDNLVRPDGKTGYYDNMPTVVCDRASGDAIVYYVKSGNPTADPTTLANPYANDSRIYYMLYNAESDVDTDGDIVPAGWLFDDFYFNELQGNSEHERFMIDSFGGQRALAGPTYPDDGGGTVAYAIPDLTSVGYNGLALSAYSIDTDGSNSTDADKELYLQVYDFEEHETKYRIALTDDVAADSLPQFFRSQVFGEGADSRDEGTHTKLFWYKGGRGVVYIDVTKLLQEGVHDDGSLITSGGDGSDREYVFTDSSGLTRYSYLEPIDVSSLTESGSAIRKSADFRVAEDVNGSLFIVWTESVVDGNGHAAQQIFATSLISSTDSRTDAEANAAGNGSSGWSKPYQLTKSERQNDEIAVAMAGENLLVVHNQYTLTENFPETDKGELVEGIADFDPIVIDNMRLVATVMSPCGAVGASEIALVDPETESAESGRSRVETPRGGEDVRLSVTVSNNGLTTAKGYRLTLFAVGKDGSESQIGETLECTEALIPNTTRRHDFAYTLPADVDGLKFKAVAREARYTGGYFTNTDEYVSEPLETRAEYTFENPVTYQTAEGFRASFTLRNTGNAASSADDTVTLQVIGPADLAYRFRDEDGILYREKLTAPLQIDESRSFDVPVAISPEMMEDYGFVSASLAVTNEVVSQVLSGKTYTDTVIVGEAAYVDFKLTAPMNMTLQDVSVTVDATEDIVCSIELGDRFGTNAALTYAVDDLTVARIQDGKVLGVGAGSTRLHATHAATGSTVSAAVTVSANGHGAQDRSDTSSSGPAIAHGSAAAVPSGTGGTADNAALCDRGATCPLRAFDDLDPAAWYHDGIHRALESGIMNGVSADTFAPNGTTTRAMLVTMLWRMAGEPKAGRCAFTDVPDGFWCEEAIAWAHTAGVVNGVTAERFSPNAPVTREQLAAILYRYAKTLGKGFEGAWAFPLSFKDADKVSDYAYEAFCYMTMNGIINGMNDGTLAPKAPATRAQIAAIFMRFAAKTA